MAPSHGRAGAMSAFADQLVCPTPSHTMFACQPVFPYAERHLLCPITAVPSSVAVPCQAHANLCHTERSLIGHLHLVIQVWLAAGPAHGAAETQPAGSVWQVPGALGGCDAEDDGPGQHHRRQVQGQLIVRLQPVCCHVCEPSEHTNAASCPSATQQQHIHL